MQWELEGYELCDVASIRGLYGCGEMEKIVQEKTAGMKQDRFLH